MIFFSFQARLARQIPGHKSKLLCSNLQGQVSCLSRPLKQFILIAKALFKGFEGSKERTLACDSVSIKSQSMAYLVLGECSVIARTIHAN